MFFGDTVNNSFANIIVYTKGDGNDIIYGFDGDDRLSIVGGSYSMAKSGDDVIVKVSKGKITLPSRNQLENQGFSSVQLPVAVL